MPTQGTRVTDNSNGGISESFNTSTTTNTSIKPSGLVYLTVMLIVLGMIAVVIVFGVIAVFAIINGDGSKDQTPTHTSAQTPIMDPSPLPVTSLPEPSPVATGAGLPVCLEIGQTYTSPKDGMQLLCVPAGEFTMGRDNTTLTYQSPAHPVYLGAYWIDETEVTNEMYAACVADNERCPLPYQTPDFLNMVASSPTYAGLPVVNTDWNAATAYCAWAGRELPTEAQWEKAARGTDGRLYPWGNEWEGSRANYCDINCEIDDLKDSRHDDFFAFVAPVGSFPDGASPYGALDMAGNVYEWVSDYWADHYIVEKTPTPNPTGPKSGQYRIVRGGSWNYEKLRCQTTDRFKSGQDFQSGYIGFRCATTAPLGPAGTTNP